MRGIQGAVVLIAAMGCGNGDGSDSDTDGGVESCAYQTEILSTVDSTDWPAGLAESLSAYQQLDGLWEATLCDGMTKADFKITARPQEEIQIITGGVSDAVCGCTQDPLYDHDNTMAPVAIVPVIEIFVPEVWEVGVDSRTYEFSGALFGPGQPLSFRACAHRQIDPAEGSEYDDAWLTLRANTDDTLGMSIKLAKLGAGDEAVTCDITDWVRKGN